MKTRFQLFANSRLFLFGAALWLTWGLCFPSLIAQVPPAGGLDPSFVPGTGTNDSVQAIAVQPDGRILIAGWLENPNGVSRYTISRLNADGSLDPSFDPGDGSDDYISSLAVQADGWVLVAGGFTRFNGVFCKGLARLHPDGSLDRTFNVSHWVPDDFRQINRVVVQADGRILVGGFYSDNVNGWLALLLRFNPDGSLDPTFQLDSQLWRQWSHINDLAVLPDGKLVIVGDFFSPSTLGIARLFPNGDLDPAFAPTLPVKFSNPDLTSVLRQPDGKLLVVGPLLVSGTTYRDRLVRLNADGSLDNGFVSQPGIGGQYTRIYAVALQPDGKLLLGGNFPIYHGETRKYLVRLYVNGTVDPDFDAGASMDVINALAVLPDGKLLVGTKATFEQNLPFGGIARLLSQLPPVIMVSPQNLEARLWTTNNLTVTATGSLPMVYNWFKNGTLLTAASRTDTLTFSAAQASDAGNYWVVVANAYGSVTSQVATVTVTSTGTQPVITQSPQDQSVVEGGNVVFEVSATGTAPLSYQWLFNGHLIGGAQSTELVLTGATPANAGDYSVRVSNPSGSVMSQVAELAVLSPPVVTSITPPVLVSPGTEVALEVTVRGTPPLHYEWHHNGEIVPGATQSQLVLPNLQTDGIGRYRVVVSNPVGRTASPEIAVQITRAGTIDLSFNPDAINGLVDEMLLQADGKVLLSGNYGFMIEEETWNDHIARLYPDGGLDPGFDTQCAVASCCETCTGHLLGLQPDGKAFVDGDYSGIVRLQANGNLDPSFEPPPGMWDVRGFLVQPDGKILVGTVEDNYPDPTVSHVRRLNSDGSFDETFQCSLTWESQWLDKYVFVWEPNGQILVGGWFQVTNGAASRGLARLNADGTLDSAFPQAEPDDRVTLIRRQPDGKILIAGDFSEVGNVARAGLARLNPDGSVDTSFNPFWNENLNISSLDLQADGKIVLAKAYLESPFPAPPGIDPWSAGVIRLNADGSLDSTFSTEAVPGGTVNKLIVQPNGRILIAGEFSSVNGVPREAVARLFGDVRPPVITHEMTNQFVMAGDDVTLAVTVTGAPPFTFQWYKDGIALTDHTNATITLAVARTSDAGLYRVVVSNAFGTATSDDIITVVEMPKHAGALDLNFNVALPNPEEILAIVQDGSGRLVIGGTFRQVGGLARNGIARLNIDGTVDSTFDPGLGGDSYVSDIKLQPDGRILAVGEFSEFDGVARNGIVRLHPDGSLDSSFDSQPGIAGSERVIMTLELQPDGRILIGGDYLSVNGVPQNGVARLRSDGSLDPTFNSGGNPTNGQTRVFALALQPDGKVLVGGNFIHSQTFSSNSLFRLNSDGSIDASFRSALPLILMVRALWLQPDGRIFVGGGLRGGPGRAIHRLLPNGQLDPTFSATLDDDAYGAEVFTLVGQQDGSILVGGQFSIVNGQRQNSLTRLNPDGTTDGTFDIGAGFGGVAEVYKLALQRDGKIVVGGDFNSFNWVPVNSIVRLHGGANAPQPYVYRSIAGAQVSLWATPPTSTWSIRD